MTLLKRALNVILLLVLSDIAIVSEALRLKPIFTALICVALSIFFIVFNIRPAKLNAVPKKMKIMKGGHELLLTAGIVFFVQIVFYLYIYLFSKLTVSIATSIVNAIVVLAVILILMWNGMLRIICTSGQLGIILRVLLLTMWWVPLVNIIILCICCRVVSREYMFETAKSELNSVRKDNEVCKTKYPVLLIHGIFWRDWQLFNYWGRIPAELKRNGAVVYYGNQQSAAPMEVVADEIKNQILKITEADGCEKVNIIAHSKGGLDARYAVSCMGIEGRVASLTTVGTPHLGCAFVARILNKLPNWVIEAVAKRYNAAYKKLGDKAPDFCSGIYDLTPEKCAEFNQKVINKEGVVYQSAASKMNSVFSAGFPLNIGYAINRKEGENDGFVTVESSKWGDYLGCYSTKKRRGVSHGDTIDLMRENVRGFDVCECYVDILKGLKAKGL